MQHVMAVIAVVLWLVAAVSAFAGPYVDYEVSSLVKEGQAVQRFNQRFGFSSSLYRDNLLAPSFELRREIDTISLLSDWYPGLGLFRLSAGVLYQPEDAAQKHSEQPYRIKLLSPDSETGFPGLGIAGVAPYVGVGWGRKQRGGSKLGFNLDMGALYQPDQTLLGEQGVASARKDSGGGQFLRELEALELSPVFSLGLSYNF